MGIVEKDEARGQDRRSSSRQWMKTVNSPQAFDEWCILFPCCFSYREAVQTWQSPNRIIPMVEFHIMTKYLYIHIGLGTTMSLQHVIHPVRYLHLLPSSIPFHMLRKNFPFYAFSVIVSPHQHHNKLLFCAKVDLSIPAYVVQFDWDVLHWTKSICYITHLVHYLQYLEL